ncbi:MAG: nicotinamide-nucleotide adenylyltransferase [Methanobacteriota archaeon]|nr:MAG: nicotinamide-nucleotide adenylyltransferase [Euryarchaeota archaeon]
MRGLIVGRFQPFHKGHLKAIQEALSQSDDIVVVIGSAEESHTADNPLTASERYQTIISSLSEEEVTRTHVVPIRDIHRYSVWVNHIESYVPPFDVVFSNSPITRSLFSQVGYEVRGTKAYNPKQYNGSEIRKRIVEGGKWRHLVPQPVARMIDELGLQERLRIARGRSTAKGRKEGAGKRHG